MGHLQRGLHSAVLAPRSVSHGGTCLFQGHRQSGSPGPPCGWRLAAGGVAVCPQPPSVHGAELGSPSRGHYSTKRISPLLTLGTPPEVKGALGSSVTSSLFSPPREKEYGLLLPPTAWLPKGWALLVGVGPPVGLDNNAKSSKVVKLLLLCQAMCINSMNLHNSVWCEYYHCSCFTDENTEAERLSNLPSTT